METSTLHVEVSFEHPRHCGFRGPAAGGFGIYLIGAGDFEPCERLPFPLEVCLCCGAGIKPARGFTWIDPITLFARHANPPCTDHVGLEVEGLVHDHDNCYLCNPAHAVGPRAGMIWIGNKFYKTGIQFMNEARQMGISRKLPFLPNDFEIGKSVVFLAHRKVYVKYDEQGLPMWGQGVFTAFKPIRVDIVVDDVDDVPHKAVEIAKRLGKDARLVKVIPIGAEGEEIGDDDF